MPIEIVGGSRRRAIVQARKDAARVEVVTGTPPLAGAASGIPQPAALEVAVTSEELAVPQKRRPGRPKGSRNRPPQAAAMESPATLTQESV